MNFEFTPRLATFFRRFVNLHINSLESEVKDSRELNNDDYERKYGDHIKYVLKGISFDNWYFQIVIKRDYDEEQDLYITDSAYLLIELSYKQISINTTIPCDFNPDLYIKQYRMCECQKNLVNQEGYCDNCYPYVITQDENCCVCHENEGVWIKLDCNHLIHLGCWKKMIGYSCPLCRNHNTDYKLI